VSQLLADDALFFYKTRAVPSSWTLIDRILRLKKRPQGPII
jgi:hypothetical protein